MVKRAFLIFVFVVVVVLPGAAYAASAPRRLPVTGQLRAEIAASYHHTHGRFPAALSSIHAVLFGRKEYVLATVDGASRQPELFTGSRKTLHDRGATGGKPCSLPPAVVHAFGYSGTCPKPAPPAPTTPTTTESPTTAKPSQPNTGWTAPDHWCSIGNPCDSAALIKQGHSCSAAAGFDCDGTLCAHAMTMWVWYAVLFEQGREMITSVSLPFDTEAAAWEWGVGDTVMTAAAAAVLQGQTNTLAYCGHDDFDAAEQESAAALKPFQIKISLGVLPSGVFDEHPALAALNDFVRGREPWVYGKFEQSTPLVQKDGSTVDYDISWDHTLDGDSLSFDFKAH